MTREMVLRSIIGIVLLAMIYRETGVVTTLFATLVLIRFEMDSFMMLHLADALKKQFPVQEPHQ